MIIRLTYGIGEGPTELAAKDRALYDAGVANYNHMALSSIIPPYSEIIEDRLEWNDVRTGRMAKAVASVFSTRRREREAWAGVGWVLPEKKEHYGLFVEHHGYSEENVIEDIKKSLEYMQTYRPQKFGEINMKVVGIKCEKDPVCALVCAIYDLEGWNSPEPLVRSVRQPDLKKHL
jgi:arginine decarboxylase